jgi:PAS domain S-box-containing protein
MKNVTNFNTVGDVDNVAFEDLFNLDEIQKIQDQFAKATGVASIITRPDGTPLTKPSNFCRLCNDIIRQTERGRINCYKSDAILGRSNPSGPIMQPCLSGGLWDGGAGISVGGVHIANWLIGQVRNETQSDEKMLHYAEEIGADRAAFKEALSEVRVMPTAQFKEVCNALFLFANQLSQTAYQNLIQERIIAERQRAEQELARAKSRIDNIINSMPSILVGINPDLEVTHWNHSAESSTGITMQEALGKKLNDLMPHLDEDIAHIETSVRQSEVVKLVHRTHMKDNRMIYEDVTVYPLVPHHLEGAVIRIDNVTERIEMEQQLAQSRKMDAIGRLAGGIAHDFNNMLGGIIGAADILENHTKPGGKQFIDIIMSAAERAAELTSNLLAFSRKAMVSKQPLDLHQTIRSVVALLERSLDKKIAIHTSMDAIDTVVRGDEPQLHTALLNIAINSGHAMKSGGVLTFSTQNTFLDKTYCEADNFHIKEGQYVEISIRDTGSGIPIEILPRIFEPFFTTKEQGKGTGLGLSAVWGTIQEHRGSIKVYSEEGTGTVFHIYLPLSDMRTTADLQESESVSGTGRILVVDDEETIRQTASAILSSLHYEVVLATNGEDAVSIFKEQHREIDLVILDMIMPKMNGREAFERMMAIDTNAKIIISSGFSKDRDLDELRENGMAAFIRKPYRKAELSRVVANVLNLER